MCLCTFQGHNLLFSFEYKYLRNITFLQQIRILGRAFLQRNFKFSLSQIGQRLLTLSWLVLFFLPLSSFT